MTDPASSGLLKGNRDTRNAARPADVGAALLTFTTHIEYKMSNGQSEHRNGQTTDFVSPYILPLPARSDSLLRSGSTG